jgi:ribonuclease P protein component
MVFATVWPVRQGAAFLAAGDLRGAANLPSEMLPKKYRLNRLQVIRVKKNTPPQQHFGFSVYTAKQELPFSRISVVTPTFLDKRAVIRNRLRRFLYSSLPSSINPGWDVVFFPSRSVLKSSNAQICSLFHQVLSKISLV